MERSSRNRGEREERSERGSRSSSREESTGRSSSRGSSSRGGTGYQYQARTAASVERRGEGGANDFDKIVKDHIKQWTPKDGKNRIRVVPPTWENPEHYGTDIWMHYGVGPDRQGYLDLFKMLGKPDPITEECTEVTRAGDDEEYAKELAAKRRVGIYLIDREDENEGVQFWAMPWTVDRDICKVVVDSETGEVLPIDHPDDGYDITFTKEGKLRNTKYIGIAVARRSTPLGNDAWLEFAIKNPIPEILNYFSYEHIAAAFGGGGTHKEKTREDDKGSDRVREDSRESRGRGREETKPDALTWEGIHELKGEALDDLIDAEGLTEIDPNKADSDEDLADWICEELKISKPEAGRRRVVNDKPEESPRDRLRSMRSGR